MRCPKPRPGGAGSARRRHAVQPTDRIPLVRRPSFPSLTDAPPRVHDDPTGGTRRAWCPGIARGCRPEPAGKRSQFRRRRRVSTIIPAKTAPRRRPSASAPGHCTLARCEAPLPPGEGRTPTRHSFPDSVNSAFVIRRRWTNGPGVGPEGCCHREPSGDAHRARIDVGQCGRSFARVHRVLYSRSHNARRPSPRVPRRKNHGHRPESAERRTGARDRGGLRPRADRGRSKHLLQAAAGGNQDLPPAGRDGGVPSPREVPAHPGLPAGDEGQSLQRLVLALRDRRCAGGSARRQDRRGEGCDLRGRRADDERQPAARRLHSRCRRHRRHPSPRRRGHGVGQDERRGLLVLGRRPHLRARPGAQPPQADPRSRGRRRTAARWSW